MTNRIIRYGTIDSDQKVKQLVGEWTAYKSQHPSPIARPIRMSCYQLNTPHYEWDLIVAQHQHLALADTQIAHIVIPTAHTYASLEELTLPPVTKRTIDMLCRQINAEGWLIYCGWLKADIEKLLPSFRPTDAAMYTLHGLLEDFCHEVDSPLLFQNHTQILDAMRRLGDQPQLQQKRSRDLDNFCPWV